jgi:hypothetical protein
MRESRFAKGGQPFAWEFGGCAPDHPSLSPAAEGGKNNFATALGITTGSYSTKRYLYVMIRNRLPVAVDDGM